MKVISGLYKGRILKGFTLEGTRPTMDRVKESLFATIQNNISGSVVLDLFAGSGNLAIEALSEGASFAYMVDYNRKAYNTINDNIKEIGIDNSNVLCMDYIRALDYFKDNDIKFDIIFLDPPYKTNYIEKANKLISQYSLLNDNGLIVCESDDLNNIIYPDDYSVVKEKKYGDKYVVLLKKI